VAKYGPGRRRDTSREGCYGNRPPEPLRAGEVATPHPKTPKGWTTPVWELRCALWACACRLPRGTGLQRFLEGVERWVKLTGRGRPGPHGVASPESVRWWGDAMAMVDVVGRIGDAGTLDLLRPWLTRPGSVGFKPFGVD
jgi:hypothetical protein